jgi:putative intracellular protease/amidase
VTAPADLADINSADWDGLCIPSCVGAVTDLASSDRLGTLIQGFALAGKPVCCIGFGVLGLARAFAGQHMGWVYEGFNVTGYSNLELARLPYFTKLPLLPEEFVQDNGGIFGCCVVPDSVHICVDRTLVSGQNVQSTTLAVLNFLWLINAIK